MYQYDLRSGNLNIKTSFVKNIDEIKTETIQMPNYVNRISYYPNGAVLEFHQYADKIIINSNVELISNPDGSYTLPE